MSRDKVQDPLSPTQIAQLANAKPQGKRPRYFTDPMAEQSHAMIMSLMAELAAARERIDTLERLLVQKSVLSADEVESYVPDEAAGEERQQAQVEYCARVLRPLQQQAEAIERQSDLSAGEMAARLGGIDPGGQKSD